MQHLVTEAAAGGADTVDPHALATQIHRYRSAAQIGITQTAVRCGTVMKKHHALARRLIDRQDDYLRFTTDWRVPADNNGSERDIRMIKLRQKVSGCLRTLTGAQQFCAIRSYLFTAAKNGIGLLDPLVTLAEGRPWLPAYWCRTKLWRAAGHQHEVQYQLLVRSRAARPPHRPGTTTPSRHHEKRQ